VINSPSNPTGSAYEKKELEALAETALKHKILIVSDEIYEKIVFDGFRQVSIASLSEEVKRRCVVINGVSKTYSMTGWRIGYLAAEREIAEACGKLQGQSTSNPASISQAGTVEALLGPQDEIARRVAEFQKRRDFLLKRLAEIPGVTCYKPAGTFYSFPDFSGVYGKRWGNKPLDGSLALTDFLLEAAKVALVPGVAFGADRNARISFAASIETLSKGLDRIAAAIAALK
jgi:aspartate aminotransferase